MRSVKQEPNANYRLKKKDLRGRAYLALCLQPWQRCLILASRKKPQRDCFPRAAGARERLGPGEARPEITESVSGTWCERSDQIQ